MENTTSDQLRDSRNLPFVMIEVAVFGRVDPHAFTVYCVIAKHAHNRTRQAWPGHRLIASEAKCSVTTVKKAIQTLQDAGLISVRKKGRVGKEHNVYTLLPAENKVGKLQNSSGDEHTPSRHATPPSRHATAPQSPRDYELDLVELDSPNKTQDRKHGVTDVTVPIIASLSKKKKTGGDRRSDQSLNSDDVKSSRAIQVSTAGKSKANAARSSRAPIPPECWQSILRHICENFQELECRAIKRDRAALRSLWALMPGIDDDDRVQAICDALDQAASGDDTAEGLFSIATQILERDYNGTRTRDVIEYGRERVSA